MPIYEFKCNRCGHTFEQLILSSHEEKNVNCPSCGEGDTSKLMSSFSCGGSGGIGKAVSSGGSSACSPSPRGFS
jgi:putative FmdB family regulatory protein